MEEKIFNLHFYFSIAESLDLMGKKENAKAMFQKEFIEQRISPDTLDTILTLKSLNDNCIKFGKKEEAIYILQKAIPIINERSTNITKPLLLLLFSNTLEVKYNFFKVLNILKEIIYSNKESILVLSDSIFEIIIKSICLLKNKHLAYYILKILDTMIQRTDYYDKKASVYFGYVSIEKIDDIEYKLENLISDIFNSDDRYSWKTPYLALIDKFSVTKNPEILYFLLNTIFDLLSHIHSIKEQDITEFIIDLCDLFIQSKNKWIGEISSTLFYIKSSSVNINNRVILNLYICIFMEEREYEFYKNVFKVVNKHLPNVTNKKEIYPKIFNLIQFIKDPDHFKIIFRKLRKYYNNQYDKLEPFDLQHNLNMANSFYRQFNFNSADFYFNRAKGIARSSKESNFIALEISKILVSNREIQKEEFFKDLFLEYLDELQNSTYSGLKIESFTSVLPEILATENIKYLYYIEKFLNAHQEEIELTKNYKSILTSHISQKKETKKLFSFFLRSFLLGPFDEALVTEQLKALTKLLANFGYCKEAIEIFNISEFLLLPKTHT